MRKSAPAIVLMLLLATLAWAQQPGVSAAQLRSLELESLGSDGIYSPFGTYFAVITRSNRVRVYNSEYDELWNYRGQGEHGTGPAIVFTSDEEYVLFPGHGSPSRIAMVRADTGELVSTLDRHTAEVKALALSPDNRWLVSVQYGGRAIVWRREGVGYLFDHELAREPSAVLSLAFAPSSDLFAIGNNEDFVELFALTDPELPGGGAARFQPAGELHPNQYYGNTAYLFGLSFSPDGRWLAAGVRDEITIWQLDGARLISTGTISDIDEGYCYALEFTPDSHVLFGGFQGSRAAAWLLQEAGEWRHETTFADRQDYVWDVAVSPDGSQVATISVTTNGVAIWALEGVDPGPLVSLSRMLADATDGDAPGQAHRSILTNAVARQLLDSLDPALFAARGMFESAAAYETRTSRVASAALLALQVKLLALAGGASADDHSRIVVPVAERGTYDVDAGRYTTAFLGIRADLAIVPEDAEGLYLHWQDARVEAITGRDENSMLFGQYELIHPVSGKRYPLVISEDPMSGVRLKPDVELSRPMQLTEDLVLEEMHLDPLFPALYRAYERQAVGHAVIRNTGDSPAENLRVTASLAKYSTEPAAAALPRALAAGDRTGIDFVLVLSDDIVISGGEETLAIEIAGSHETQGHSTTGSVTALVSILNRNAIRWDDDLKVGAFMTTVQSPTIMTLAGQAAADTAEVVSAALPRTLLIGMRVLEQLRARGIAYRVDPASAYANLSQESGAIDFLQFPAETLSYGAGDCDDLSVLYNSILEAAGVRTAFVTTPGHIFTAFSLGRASQEISGVFPDPGEFIIRDGEVWLPVETTLLGLGFRQAWQVGARQWRAGEANRSARLFTTEEAWQRYPPVPWEPPVPDQRARTGADRFEAELDNYVSEAIDLMVQGRGITAPSGAREYNILGTIYARFGLVDEAQAQFEQAVRLADYVPAIINLASLSGMRGDHETAMELLGQANDLSPGNPRILLGLAVAHLEDGQRGSARGFYDQVAELDPALAQTYPLFGADTAEPGAARASASDALQEYRAGEWAE